MIGKAGHASDAQSLSFAVSISAENAPADQGTKFVDPGYDFLQDEYEYRNAIRACTHKARADRARAEEIARFSAVHYREVSQGPGAHETRANANPAF